MAIVLREVKGSKLTHAELDNNFNELDSLKMDAAVYNSNNTIVIKDDSGNLVEVAVAASRVIGRTGSSEIKDLTMDELKGLLYPANSGWGAPTGTATKTTFATSTVTLEQLAERVKALTDALIATKIINV